MKTAKERMLERMRKPRVITPISLRVPESVIDTLKEIAPSLGFSGYQALIKAYISEGLQAYGKARRLSHSGAHGEPA